MILKKVVRGREEFFEFEEKSFVPHLVEGLSHVKEYSRTLKF